MNRMHLIALNPIWLERYLPLILWVNFIFIMYLPLLIGGGIIIDDWGGVAHNFQCEGIFNSCFIDQYRNTFLSVFTNRPLAALPIVVSTILFKTHFTWYLYLNTTLFLSAILITAWVIDKLSGKIAAIIFAYVAAIPLISMPLVVSPINLMDSTQAYLFWAISLFLLYSYCKKNSFFAYVGSYLLLVCGFFTYEVFLPLLTMNALIPFLLNRREYEHKKLRYFYKFIVPLFVVLTIVYLWQKVIGPHYYEIPSRLNFAWGNVIPSFLSWVNIFATDIPMLFFKARKFLSIHLIIYSLVYVTSIVISWRVISSNKTSHDEMFAYLIVCTLCLLCSSLILVLSGTRAIIGGYESRALSSTWFGFAFFCSALSVFFYNQINSFLKKIVVALFLAILFFCCLSFGIQKENYIKSWEMQMHLVNDALELIAKEDIVPGALIIANVPAYLEKNYNNELIFDTPWDFGSALRIFTNSLIAGGTVIDAKNRNFHNAMIVDGIFSMDQMEKINNFSNLWLYDYVSNLKKGTLVKINSAHELKVKLALLGLPFYLGEDIKTSAIKRNEKIAFSYEWQNRSFYIKNGFSDRETWGIWSLGKEALLVLPLPSDGAQFLTLDLRAFVSKAHPIQRVEVTVDGVKRYQYTLNNFDNNEIRIPIFKSTSAKEKIINLHFSFLDAVSPQQIGIAPDDRVLAIGFKNATFH